MNTKTLTFNNIVVSSNNSFAVLSNNSFDEFEQITITARKLTPAGINEGYHRYLLYTHSIQQALLEDETEKYQQAEEMLGMLADMPALKESLPNAISSLGKKKEALQSLQRQFKKSEQQILSVFDSLDSPYRAVDMPPADGYYWQLAENILSNPVYVEVCTGMSFQEFQQISDEDFIRVCEEVYLLNHRFFLTKFPRLKQPTPRPEV